MAKVLIEESTLTNIADAIRVKTGKTSLMKPSEMGGAIENIKIPKGMIWRSTALDFGNYTLSKFFEANGRLYINSSSKTYYTDDGETFASISAELRGMVYANGLWVTGSNSGTGLRYSTDGKTWTQSNITSGNFYSVYYSNGLWVAGGTGLWYSTDGKTWTQSNVTKGVFIFLYYANGVWVAGTNTTNGLWYSTDGKTWTQSNIKSGYGWYAYYSNGIWVAGTSDGDYSNGFYYSTDGKTWTQSNVTSGKYFSVHYANGIWVASCTGGLYYSTNGKTWTQSMNGYFYYIHYSNGIWVVGSTSETGLYYSTDGKTWVKSEVLSDVSIRVLYANGLFVACKSGSPYDKSVYYSTDGINWKESLYKGEFYALTYFKGKYFCGRDELFYTEDFAF